MKPTPAVATPALVAPDETDTLASNSSWTDPASSSKSASTLDNDHISNDPSPDKRQRSNRRAGNGPAKLRSSELRSNVRRECSLLGLKLVWLRKRSQTDLGDPGNHVHRGYVARTVYSDLESLLAGYRRWLWHGISPFELSQVWSEPKEKSIVWHVWLDGRDLRLRCNGQRDSNARARGRFQRVVKFYSHHVALSAKTRFNDSAFIGRLRGTRAD